MSVTVRSLERIDFEGIAGRLSTFARRDAALVPIGDRSKGIDDLAYAAIDKASSWVLDVEHPALPAYAVTKLYWTYVGAFAEAKAQMARWW